MWTNKIKKLADFVAVIYGRYFLQSALSISAPRLDVELLHDVKIYQVSNVSA
jgi:hypothetical protein